MDAGVNLAAIGGISLGYCDGLVIRCELFAAPRAIDFFQEQVDR
jgi:hypothetical protein